MRTFYLYNGIYFIVGGCVGALAARYYFKKKYNKQLQENVQSVIDIYEKKENINTELGAPEPIEDSKETEEVKPEHKIETNSISKIEVENYVDYAGMYSNKTGKKEEKGKENIYIISPDEHGETGYKTVEIDYYENDIYTNSSDYEEIDAPEVLFGFNPFEHKNYPGDYVYVRNDSTRTDYAIYRTGCEYMEGMDDDGYSSYVND